MKITQKIKTLFQTEVFRIVCLLIALTACADIFAVKVTAYQDAQNQARIAERDRLAELQHEYELQQTAMVDSISVVFMKAWAKVKDTEEFKHCAYYRFRANASYNGTVDLVQADISCGEIKDLPDIGKFKPTAMVPGAEGAAMTVIYKFFPNK